MVNLVCAILQHSARTHDVPLDRLSFKGTLAALRHWAPLLMKASPRRQRRPKVYQLLTKPRRQMVVSASLDLKK